MEKFKKFTGKTEHYSRYRPTYPETYLRYLSEQIRIADTTVADVGSGTGIFARAISPFVRKVYAVEPNTDMRESSISQNTGFDNITVMDGLAENTGLPLHSVDLVTAAQAFHWFDIPKFREECRRILKPHGKVALVWNSLDSQDNVIMAIHRLCEHLQINYIGFNSGRLPDAASLNMFFNNGNFRHETFSNAILSAKEPFIGRYLSSSYAPEKGSKNYDAYRDGLTDIFEQYKDGTMIDLPYKTLSYIGEV